MKLIRYGIKQREADDNGRAFDPYFPPKSPIYRPEHQHSENKELNYMKKIGEGKVSQPIWSLRRQDEYCHQVADNRKPQKEKVPNALPHRILPSPVEREHNPGDYQGEKDKAEEHDNTKLNSPFFLLLEEEREYNGNNQREKEQIQEMVFHGRLSYGLILLPHSDIIGVKNHQYIHQAGYQDEGVSIFIGYRIGISFAITSPF